MEAATMSPSGSAAIYKKKMLKEKSILIKVKGGCRSKNNVKTFVLLRYWKKLRQAGFILGYPSLKGSTKNPSTVYT